MQPEWVGDTRIKPEHQATLAVLDARERGIKLLDRNRGERLL
jgi:hypothetical protein